MVEAWVAQSRMVFMFINLMFINHVFINLAFVNPILINLIFINLISFINLILGFLFFVYFFFIFMSEPRARPIAVSLLSLLLLLLPTGSLFGATGWELESEVVLISGRAPPIEKSHLAVFLSRQTPGEETSRKTEVGI